jgi:sugar/nucleoside kinase (ribokinase family)
MIRYVVYGKIIIDTIKGSDGTIVENVLGGGGPQGAFGARLWDESVGLLSRSGTDILPAPRQLLEDIGFDLSGWVQFSDLPTAHIKRPFSEQEVKNRAEEFRQEISRMMSGINEMVSRPIPLPAAYQRPDVIHLITEHSGDAMIENALALKEAGAIFSLEPIIMPAYHNQEDILPKIRLAGVVTPDFPAASALAGSEDPLEVMKYWSKLGPSLVAIRHGYHGSYTWDREHDQYWHIMPVPVKVVDVTGAGNCYGGGLIVGWNRSRDARTAGCYASVSASFVVERYGLPKVTDALQSEAAKLLDLALVSAKRLG